jgi:hypothetical protein
MDGMGTGPTKMEGFTLRSGVVTKSFSAASTHFDASSKTKRFVDIENLKIQFFDGEAESLRFESGPMFEVGEIITLAYKGRRLVGICNHTTAKNVTYYNGVGVFLLLWLGVIFLGPLNIWIDFHLKNDGIDLWGQWLWIIMVQALVLIFYGISRRHRWNKNLNEVFSEYHVRLRGDVDDPSGAWQRAHAARRVIV